MKEKAVNINFLLDQRDKKAISYLYDQYAPTLYGIILRIVHMEDIAQDVLQETFIKAWRNGHRFDESKGTLFTWLLNIARNNAIDKIRSRHYKNGSRVQSLNPELYNNKSYSTENNPEHIGLQDAVDGLDEKYRIIIDLIYFQGFTQAEVQKLLDIPLGTVKSRTRIGLRKLRQLFVELTISVLILLLLAVGV